MMRPICFTLDNNVFILTFYRDVMQTCLTRQHYDLLYKYSFSLKEFLESMNNYVKLTTFTSVHQLLDQKINVVKSVVQVLETVDNIRVMYHNKNSSGDDATKVDLTCEWVLQEFVKQCKNLRKHFDKPEAREKFMALMLTKAHHVEMLLSSEERRFRAQDWYPLLVQQQLCHMLDHFNDKLKGLYYS